MLVLMTVGCGRSVMMVSWCKIGNGSRCIFAEEPRFFDLDFRQFLKKRVPITEWLPKYSFSFFLQDLLAGFTVSLTEIPQGIAYAGVIGKSSTIIVRK